MVCLIDFLPSKKKVCVAIYKLVFIKKEIVAIFCGREPKLIVMDKSAAMFCLSEPSLVMAPLGLDACFYAHSLYNLYT